MHLSICISRRFVPLKRYVSRISASTGNFFNGVITIMGVHSQNSNYLRLKAKSVILFFGKRSSFRCCMHLATKIMCRCRVCRAPCLCRMTEKYIRQPLISAIYFFALFRVKSRYFSLFRNISQYFVIFRKISYNFVLLRNGK